MAVASSRFLSAAAPLRESSDLLKQAHEKDTLLHVFFRLPGGQTCCLQTDPDTETLVTLKTRLVSTICKPQHSLSRSGSHVRRQLDDTVWIWNAKVLNHHHDDDDDDDTLFLRDYGCMPCHKSSHMTIHVSEQRRGGCFMVSLSILCIICMALVGSTCTCGLSLLIVPLLLPLLFILPLFCL